MSIKEVRKSREPDLKSLGVHLLDGHLCAPEITEVNGPKTAAPKFLAETLCGLG